MLRLSRCLCKIAVAVSKRQHVIAGSEHGLGKGAF